LQGNNFLAYRATRRILNGVKGINPVSTTPLPEVDDSDVGLIRRIGTGDRASFEEFYARFSGVIYSTALRVLNQPSDAEDVTQEVFVMIWDKAPMYDPSRGKPMTWAITMTRNKAIDKLRALQRRFRLNDEVQKETRPDDLVHQRQPSDEADAAESGRTLRGALQRLGTDQREVIEMAFFGGLTQHEIAGRLGEPLGTVKARMRRGMMRLRKMVGANIRTH